MHKGLFAITRVVVFLIVASAVSLAQSGVPDQGEGMSRRQADQMLQELRQIRLLLERQQPGRGAQAAAPQPPQKAAVSISGLNTLGSPDAPLTIVAFSDYQCPYCRAFHTTTFGELKKNWIDTGKARFVSADMPLAFHSNALKAAQAARCAGEQKKFWEMRDLLITNASKLAPDDILGYGSQLNLNPEQFRACVTSDRFLEEIKKTVADANSKQISGTPAFVIGKSNGETVDGRILVGAQPYVVFDSFLKQQLESVAKGTAQN